MSTTQRELSMSKTMHRLLKDYIEYCDQTVDYNFPVPRIIKRGVKTYTVKGDVRNVRCAGEPSLRGFLEWLERESM